MTSLLLLLSFLLHLILFIILIRLVQHMQQLKQNQTEQLETLIAEFTEELRMQNERLERSLSNPPQAAKPFQSSFQHALEQLNDEASVVQRDDHETVKTVTSSTATTNVLSTADKEDKIEMSLESKVMQLAAEGKSVSEIAKQLNRGKTEIELLLKLSQQTKQEDGQA